MSRYVVIVEDVEGGGYDAWCPDLPGCAAYGDTYQECVAKMREAMAIHLQGLERQGEPIPEPSASPAAP
jgi:predicted RNase H-like HicB family nuclease